MVSNGHQLYHRQFFSLSQFIPMSLKDQLKKDAISRILDAAQKMLSGDMHLVEGSRLICKLRMNIDNPDPEDKIYDVFVMVKYETHDLPVVMKEGSKYQGLLKQANEKIENYTNLMKPVILRACSTIIASMSEAYQVYH